MSVCWTAALGIVVAMSTVAGVVVASPADASTTASPRITKVSPASGSGNGGTRVTVSGSGFTHLYRVLFGSTPGTSVHEVNSRELLVTAPRHTAGTANIRVQTRIGTTVRTSAVTSKGRYTFYAPPAVTSLSSTSGPTAGGGKILVHGTHIRASRKVLFGTTPSPAIHAVSGSEIQVTVPKHVAGTVNIRYVNAYGTSPVTSRDRYTYVAPPTITSIAPTSGSTAGGTPLVIRGTSFDRITKIVFGTTAGTGTHAVSTTEATVTAPGHAAGAVDVRVVTAYGTSRVVQTDRFTYAAAPVVTGLSVASGPVVGGSAVTITGRNLSQASSVLFGSNAATGLVRNSASSLSVVSPPGIAGTVDVRVVASGLTSATSTADRFTFSYPAAQQTSAYTPATDTHVSDPGDVVAVSGGAFTGSAATMAQQPWQVTLAEDATLPATGDPYYVPPGTAAYPSGLVGTVSDIADGDDGQHQLTVTPTPVDQVLSDTSVDYTGPDSTPPAATNARIQRPAAEGGTAQDSTPLTSTIAFPAIDASDDAEVDCDHSVKPTGSVSLTLQNVHAHVEVDTGLFRKPFIEAYVSYETVISAQLGVEGEATCELSAEWQNEHTKLFLLGDTGATLAFAPDVTFTVSAAGTVTVSQHSYHTIGFISQPDGSIQRLDAKSADPSTVEASGSLTAEAYAGVQIQVGMLNVLGVGLSAGIGATATATATATTAPPQICVSVGPFIRATLYAYLNLWVKEWKLQAFQVELDLPSVSRCVATASAPPAPPKPPSAGLGPTYLRTSGPAGFVTKVNGLTCPTPPSGYQEGFYEFSSNGDTLHDEVGGGTPASAATVSTDSSAAPGIYTGTVGCEHDDNKGGERIVDSTYHFTQTITQPASHVQVSPSTPEAGQAITISDGGGCGAYNKNSTVDIELSYNVDDSPVSLGENIPVNSAGHWGPISVKLPKDFTPGSPGQAGAAYLWSVCSSSDAADYWYPITYLGAQ